MLAPEPPSPLGEYLSPVNVSGELAVITITVNVANAASPDAPARRASDLETDMLIQLSRNAELRERFQEAFRKAVRHAAGRDVDVDDFIVQTGSLEFILILYDDVQDVQGLQRVYRDTVKGRRRTSGECVAHCYLKPSYCSRRSILQE